MSNILITNLVPGMKVSKEVINKHDIKLLSKGTILSQYTIDYLNRWEIDSIHIEEEKEEVIDIRREKQDLIVAKHRNALNKTEKFMEGLQGSGKLKLDDIRDVIDDIYNTTEISSIFQIVNGVKDKDKYTFQHSMNVAIYASLIGKWIGLDKPLQKKLVYAGLLHDIGKAQVAKEILDKPSKLSKQEYEEIKKHPIYGYNLVKQNGNISHSIALGILQHHEREDGKGYPLGVLGGKIHLFAKIIAIADIYDAMTSTRVYKGRQSPLKTIEELINDSYGRLDSKLVNIFTSRLVDFYIGATIILDNGEHGEIISNNPKYPTKPLIRVDNVFIDLSKETKIVIQDVLIT